MEAPGADPKSYEEDRKRRDDSESCPSQHHRLAVCLLDSEDDFARLCTGERNVPLQLIT
jgi:hypothetical protein